MTGKILIVADDLFFVSKIQETAKLLDIHLETTSPEAARERVGKTVYTAIIVDLNHRSGRAIDMLHDIKQDPSSASIPTLGFLSHVQAELAAAAREAGCDVVMARSAFSQRLPEILSNYATQKPSGTSGLAR